MKGTDGDRCLISTKRQTTDFDSSHHGEWCRFPARLVPSWLPHQACWSLRTLSAMTQTHWVHKTKKHNDEAQVSGSESKSTSNYREEMLGIHTVKCTTQSHGLTNSYLTLFTQPGYRRNDKFTPIYFSRRFHCSSAFGFKPVSTYLKKWEMTSQYNATGCCSSVFYFQSVHRHVGVTHWEEFRLLLLQ